MNQTESNPPNSTQAAGAESEERIRKIFVKDLKVGEVVHTVFRAAHKEKHQSRGGKSYLTLVLVDRTGTVDGRVFDNVEAADQAFSTDDYLLVKGKIGSFHGKSQIVVERLERLDPEPIDPAAFAYSAPIVPTREERPVKAEAPQQGHHEDEVKLRLSKRLERLLQNPQLAQALDTFVSHLEKALATLPPKPERPERKPKGPKVEHRPARHGHAEPQAAAEAKPEKPAAKRDPSLPEGLAFKPFTALVTEPTPAEAPATPAPSTEG